MSPEGTAAAAREVARMQIRLAVAMDDELEARRQVRKIADLLVQLSEEIELLTNDIAEYVGLMSQFRSGFLVLPPSVGEGSLGGEDRVSLTRSPLPLLPRPGAEGQHAGVRQLAERRAVLTERPLVGGSIPPPGAKHEALI